MSAKPITSKLSTIFSAVGSGGLKFVSYRLYEEFNERRLNVRTTGLVSAEELGYESAEFFEYTPAPYRALRDSLGRVAVRPGEDAFLDYGCGLGRAIVVAGTMPFRRVVGIDLSPLLVERALENLRRAGRRLKCEVRAEVADAQTYALPDDITVVHLYNPFVGDTLARAVANIRASLRRRPRDLTIIYGNPGKFEQMFYGQGWLERKSYKSFHPRTSYGIYQCRAEAESR